MTKNVTTAFLRYGLTGGTAAIVDAGLFYVLTAAGTYVLWASPISFSAAAIVNYLLTSTFVFKTRPTRARFLPFVALAVVGLIINSTVTIAAIHFFGFIPIVSKLVGIAVAFVFNFAFNYLVVFRQKSWSSPARLAQ
jgi:putative flippase GtrA